MHWFESHTGHFIQIDTFCWESEYPEISIILQNWWYTDEMWSKYRCMKKMMFSSKLSNLQSLGWKYRIYSHWGYVCGWMRPNLYDDENSCRWIRFTIIFRPAGSYYDGPTCIPHNKISNYWLRKDHSISILHVAKDKSTKDAILYLVQTPTKLERWHIVIINFSLLIQPKKKLVIANHKLIK